MDKLFNFADRNVSARDLDIARHYLGSLDRPADLVIAPVLEAGPYIYRWHLIRDSKVAGVYFHIQVSDDPERPLHDHPWDNMSVILGGDGYREVLMRHPETDSGLSTLDRRPGDVIFRRATEAHRLFMPTFEELGNRKPLGYTMSQFSMGPKVRDWGFWYPDGWRSYEDVTRLRDGVSYHVKTNGAPV